MNSRALKLAAPPVLSRSSPAPETHEPDTFSYGPNLIYRENRVARRLRRTVDAIVAVALLTVALPVMLVACLAILIEDGAPVLFTQRRAGRFERTFTIFKLRTMKRDRCDDRQSPVNGSDDRVTRVGAFIRKTSIDELPQLFNVIRGQMSLIGPRPEMPIIMTRYEGWQHLRHLVDPGLTCIWQATCRKTVPLDRPEATALDLDYIRRASPMLDGALLLRTAATVVFPKGAF
jgi:lipopolysaccharide/colanic/teichoic acid biosynthesis glycosyltransferase